jgi:hypothetical protein
MRARFLSIALPLVLMAPTFAQQSGDSPQQQVQQQTAAPPDEMQARIGQSPSRTDGRSLPGLTLVRAKDTNGNTVLMVVNPDTGEAIPLGTANQRQQQQQALQQQMQQGQLQQQHAPQKTIGHPQSEVVPSLILFNARGASLQGGKLLLTGVSPTTILVGDRPMRAAGQDLTAHVIGDWASGSENLASDPPSATVSGFNKEGSSVRDAVVVLKTPKLEGDHLTFDADVLEGDLTGADGPAAVFIDISDRSLAPMSVGRVARRGAWYAGAGGMGGGPAAYGASAACGHSPYPPCY